MLMSGDLRVGSVCSSNSVSALMSRSCSTAWARTVHGRLQAGAPGPGTGPGRPRRREPGGVRPPRRLLVPGPCSGSRCRSARLRLGALNLYRERMGGPSDDQHADGPVMDSLAEVLATQAHASPGARGRTGSVPRPRRPPGLGDGGRPARGGRHRSRSGCALVRDRGRRRRSGAGSGLGDAHAELHGDHTARPGGRRSGSRRRLQLGGERSRGASACIARTRSGGERRPSRGRRRAGRR